MEGQEVLGDLREGIVGPHGFGCAHAVDVVADERPVGADDEDCRRVEADAHVRVLGMAREVVDGDPLALLALARPAALDREPLRRIGADPHFHEREHVAVQGDDLAFARAASPALLG